MDPNDKGPVCVYPPPTHYPGVGYQGNKANSNGDSEASCSPEVSPQPVTPSQQSFNYAAHHYVDPRTIGQNYQVPHVMGYFPNMVPNNVQMVQQQKTARQVLQQHVQARSANQVYQQQPEQDFFQSLLNDPIREALNRSPDFIDDFRHLCSCFPYLFTFYDVEGILGRGGQGSVFSGFRKKDRKPVAIKLRKKKNADDFIRAQHEIKLHKMAARRNKGVVQLLEDGCSGTLSCFIMERPSGKDLFEIINKDYKQQGLPENIARKITYQLLVTLIKCHENGVCHRDIKDENIIVCMETLRVRIIDFGCAVATTGDNYLIDFAGTDEFYPPEYFEKGRYKGKSVDTWSLGVVVYLMLEGELPFAKPRQSDWTLKFRSSSRYSETCRNFITRLLEHDENMRLSAVECLQDPWLLAI